MLRYAGTLLMTLAMSCGSLGGGVGGGQPQRQPEPTPRGGSEIRRDTSRAIVSSDSKTGTKSESSASKKPAATKPKLSDVGGKVRKTVDESSGETSADADDSSDATPSKTLGDLELRGLGGDNESNGLPSLTITSAAGKQAVTKMWPSKGQTVLVPGVCDTKAATFTVAVDHEDSGSVAIDGKHLTVVTAAGQQVLAFEADGSCVGEGCQDDTRVSFRCVNGASVTIR